MSDRAESHKKHVYKILEVSEYSWIRDTARVGLYARFAIVVVSRPLKEVGSMTFYGVWKISCSRSLSVLAEEY